MKITLVFMLFNVCVLCSMLCSDIAEAHPKDKPAKQFPPLYSLPPLLGRVWDLPDWKRSRQYQNNR